MNANDDDQARNEAARLTDKQALALVHIDKHGDFRTIHGRIRSTLKRRGLWHVMRRGRDLAIELTPLGSEVLTAWRKGRIRPVRKPSKGTRRIAHLRALVAAVGNGQGEAYLEEHGAELAELT